MGIVRVFSLWVLCITSGLAQQYIISTVAGGSPLPTPVAATTVPLSAVSGVATDSGGNVYFTSANCIFKLDQNGIMTRLAGTSRAGYSGDGGPALSAQLNNPSALAADHAGNIFVLDSGNGRIRKVSSSGVITTIAGGGNVSPGDGGAATSAAFFYANGLTVDALGNVFIPDILYGAVRKISPNGLLTTVAGNGTHGYSRRWRTSRQG